MKRSNKCCPVIDNNYTVLAKTPRYGDELLLVFIKWHDVAYIDFILKDHKWNYIKRHVRCPQYFPEEWFEQFEKGELSEFISSYLQDYISSLGISDYQKELEAYLTEEGLKLEDDEDEEDDDDDC